MTRYLWTRVGLAVIALLGVLLFVFVAARLTGDPTYLLAGDSPTPEDIARIHRQLGLDKPVFVQFFVFLGEVVRGDFGQSIHYHQPVLLLLSERVPATVELVVAAFLLSQLLGCGARRRGRRSIAATASTWRCERSPRSANRCRTSGSDSSSS